MTGAFSWTSAALQFFRLSGGGFLLGLAIAWTIGQARVGLRRFCADDPTIQTVISLLTPYSAYLAAEALGIGSILAVVGAGLYAGAHDLRNLDAATRAHSWEVWRMVLFAFNGLVFVLLGVQLHSIIGALSRSTALELAGYALALSAIVIVLRILWVFPACVPALAAVAANSRTRRRAQSARSVPDRMGGHSRVDHAGRRAFDSVRDFDRRTVSGPRADHPACSKRDHRHAAGQRHDASVC
jgi:NhaP-type Na+/H+ and K+/H+ antiporters